MNLRRWRKWTLVSSLLLVGSVSTSEGRALVWPSVVLEVAEDLQSDELVTRRDATRRLSSLPRAAARRLLPKALLDVDPMVRVSAAHAAIRFDYEAAGDVVLDWLGDKEPAVRRVAAEVLYEFPRRGQSLVRLTRALGDPEKDVRLAVVRALGASNSGEAVSALLAHIDDRQPDVAVAIVDALERLGDARSVVPLIGRIDDSRSSIRRSVAKALGTLGGDAAVSALVLALRDSDARVRLAVVSALGRTKDAAAVDALAVRLDEDGDIDVRVAVLHALAEIRSSRAVGILVDQLSSRRTELASEAARLIRQLGPGAAKDMAACVTSRQKERAQAEGCARALGSMRSAESYPQITAAWQTRSIGARTALAAFGDLGDPRALPVVLEQLSSADALVRLAAVKAATQLLDAAGPDGRAVEPISVALRAAARRPEETVALLTLLGKTRAPRAASVLARAASEAPLRSRVAALRGLGLVGMPEPEQEGVAVAALTAEHGVVRFEAAVALRRSASERVLPRLFELLESTAIVDRQAVATALAGPMSRSRSAEWTRKLRRAIEGADLPLQTALVEALALSGHESAHAELVSLGQAAPSLRAKLAEMWPLRQVLIGVERESVVEVLLPMLSDAASETRANAVWALGQLGAGVATELLQRLVADAEVAVAANAVLALARIGPTKRVVETLCAALSDERPHVRVNALVGLRRHRLRCAGGKERLLLERDGSALVREHAARLMVAVPPEAPEERRIDELLLNRAAHVDASGRVAGASAGRALESQPDAPGDEQVVTVFVVPAGRTRPAPAARYAVNLGDGALRLGWADARGALTVPAPQTTMLRLEVAPGSDSP